jgi:glycerol-3-phosphate dehydrogenase
LIQINRSDHINDFKQIETFDVAIIGGGASGLGIALDSASRGLKTVLFEQSDFSKGTSSKSTKLVHGGVRYLAQGNVRLVREALLERGLLERNAAHLFKRQEFIIPLYKWWQSIYYALGLKIYDWLSGRMSLGKSRFISLKALSFKLPTIRKQSLFNGITYYDGQFDDARLALNLAQSAIEHQAYIFNYMKVTGFLENDQNPIGLRVRDIETGNDHEVYSKVIVNASGVYTDKVMKLLNPSRKKTVIPSQGIHLVLEHKFLKSESAIMIPKTSDGRVLFVIPWHGKVIAGTTDTPIKKPKLEPNPLAKEIEFILNTLSNYLNTPVTKDDVLSVFSGLRPLARSTNGNEHNTKEFSRSHKITVEQNIISIIGGKWTTYRKMAEETVNVICKILDRPNLECKTQKLLIHGSTEKSRGEKPKHWYVYGTDVTYLKAFQDGNPEYQKPLHPDYDYTEGEVRWSAKYEMARTTEDFLARRCRLLFLDVKAARSCALRVSEILAEELGKSNEWIEEQLNSFNKLADKYQIPESNE